MTSAARRPPPVDAPGSGADELWRRFKLDRNEQARSAIFALYQPFAAKVARRHFRDRTSGDIEYQELCQFAYEGLLVAMDRYDPARGVPFEPYAVRRISGSILDGLNKLSEIREQLSFRRRVTRERVRSLAEGQAGGDADDALARLADLAVGLALGFMLEDTSLMQVKQKSDAADAYESVAWKELMSILAAEVGDLPERERMVIREHYFTGLSLDQIGQILQVTRGRVSQIHRAALARLQEGIRMRNGPGLGP